MLAALAISVLLASAYAEPFRPVSDNDPEIQTVKDAIAQINYFLEDHLFTKMNLPDIGGYLPFDVIQLRNGRIGQFNTFQLQGSPDLKKRQNSDGSFTYLFDVRMELKEFHFIYQYRANLARLVFTNGTVTLTPTENTFQAKGLVVVSKNGECEAEMHKIAVNRLSDFKLSITPSNVPGVNYISEAILNYATPKLLPVTNIALEGLVFSSSFQELFSELVCKAIVSPTHAPTEAPTQAPTEATTEAPTEAPSEEPSQQPTEEPVQKTTEEPAQEPTEKP